MEIENRSVGKSIVIPKKTKTEGMYYSLCLKGKYPGKWYIHI